MKSGKRQGQRPVWMAYHAAGQAVVADYFNVLMWVQLWPDPGAVVGSGDETADGPVLYAGPLAQARFQRASLSGAFLHAGRDHAEALQKLVDRQSPAVPPEVKLQEYRDVARAVLFDRWPAVEAVASALLDRGHLADIAVRGIVQEHIPDIPDLRPLVVK